MPETTHDHLDEFRAALDDAGVTHETVELAEARAAIDRAVEPPAVGVPLDDTIDAELELPATVKTEFVPPDLQTARTGVTPVRAGVAETGSLLVPSGSEGEELVSLYPERHVAVLDAKDPVADIDAGFEWLDGEVAAGRDSYVFATGVSATADMGALVEGVHGPTEVHVVVVES